MIKASKEILERDGLIDFIIFLCQTVVLGEQIRAEALSAKTSEEGMKIVAKCYPVIKSINELNLIEGVATHKFGSDKSYLFNVALLNELINQKIRQRGGEMYVG